MDFSILFDLYRSTFVRRIQDRFRYMLDDLNLATAVQAINNFDSALQDHLADVWTTLHLDQDIVSESLGQELVRSFLRFSGQQGSHEEAAAANDQVPERRNGQMPRYRRTFAFDEYLAGRVRDVESQHRQSLQDLNEVYAEVVGVAPELLPPAPWSPSATLNALSAVLDGIDVPIHQNVRVILYEKFIKDVLKHLGEACRSFQEALEKHRIESDVRITSAGPKASMGVLRGEMEKKAVTDVVAGGASRTRETKIDEGEAEVAGEPGEFEGGNSEVPWRRRYVRLLVYLLTTVLFVIVAWQLGTWLAQYRHGSMAQSGGGEHQQVDSIDQIEEAASTKSVSAGSTQEQRVQPPVVSDARMKRDVLRLIELVDFSWTLTPPDNTMLFDFSIRNGSARRVSGIEVVCLQYSQEFELLEPLKAILPGAIEPNMTQTFSQIPAGLGNDQVSRVSCFIPDVSLE